MVQNYPEKLGACFSFDQGRTVIFDKSHPDPLFEATEDAVDYSEDAGIELENFAQYVAACYNACRAAGLSIENLRDGMFFFKPYEVSDEGVTDTVAADAQALKLMVAPTFALGDYVEAIVDIDDRMMYPNDDVFVDGTLVYSKGSKGYVTYAGDGAELELAEYGLTICVQFDDRDSPAETWQVNPRWFRLTVRD